MRCGDGNRRCYLAAFGNGGRGLGWRNAGGLQKSTNTRKHCHLEPPDRNAVLLTLWFWLSEPTVAPLHSRTVRIQFLSYYFSGNLLQQWYKTNTGFPGACNAGDPGLIPGLGKIPWRRVWLPAPVLLPGEFHGERSLAGYSPWGRRVGRSWAALTRMQWDNDYSLILLQV